MNTANTFSANPFGLMLDPQSVLDTVQSSPALGKLRQQQYMLLDRPAGAVNAELAAYDARQEALVLEEEPAEELPISESIGGSHNYQSFPRVFN